MGQREMLSLNYMLDEQGLHIRMPDQKRIQSISYVMRLIFQMMVKKQTFQSCYLYSKNKEKRYFEGISPKNLSFTFQTVNGNK